MDTTLRCNKSSRRLLSAFPIPVAPYWRVEVDAWATHHYLLASNKVKAEVLSRSKRRKSNLRPRWRFGYQRPLPRNKAIQRAGRRAFVAWYMTSTPQCRSISQPSPCLMLQIHTGSHAYTATNSLSAFSFSIWKQSKTASLNSRLSSRTNISTVQARCGGQSAHATGMQLSVQFQFYPNLSSRSHVQIPGTWVAQALVSKTLQ